MEHVNTLLDLVAGTVAEVAHSDVVVGEPIELGEVTIVPLSRVSLGFGGGGGEGEGKAPKHRRRSRNKNGGGKPDANGELAEGRGTGGGVGGGGKVRPVGVIVFTSEGVTIESIPDKKGVFDKIFDKVPEIIDMVNDARHAK